MKILVPTDFSDYARYAFDTALILAAKTNAEIHLFHAADIPVNWENLSVEERYKDTVNKSIALYARNQMADLKKEATVESIHCECHYSGDHFLQNIESLSDKLGIDLVVMGSHGASGKEEWFIGSNTQKVVRRLRRNILVVKNPVKKFQIRNVAFVSNLHEDDQDAFNRFIDFIAPFNNVKLHLLSIDTLGWFMQPGIIIKEAFKDFQNLAMGYECKTHFYKDYSVDAGIRHFSEEFDIDLVAISNHKRHPLKRFFQGSNVEMLVNHSEVPVLSVDYS